MTRILDGSKLRKGFPFEMTKMYENVYPHLPVSYIYSIYIYRGFLKWWYPTAMGFPTKHDHFGFFLGYHHLRKHPYIRNQVSIATWYIGSPGSLVPNITGTRRSWYSLPTSHFSWAIYLNFRRGHEICHE